MQTKSPTPLKSISGPIQRTENPQGFESREEAGLMLSERLKKYSCGRNVVVLAFPKGGLQVGAEVAACLLRPLDLLLVREITAPRPHRAVIGAITSGGVRKLNHALIDRLQLSDAEVRAAVLSESLTLGWRENLLRGNVPALAVADMTVIVVDDGSTSMTRIVDAIHLLRRRHAERIVVAVPVVVRDSAEELRLVADELVTLVEPETAIPIAKYYKHFPFYTGAELRVLLKQLSGTSAQHIPLQ